METPPAQSYTINGVKVLFPCKAYPSQLSMMDKILKGLDRSQNCLLESPTGSGKSLALLCSVLAWQAAEHEKARLEKEREEEEEENGAGGCCQCNRVETSDTGLPKSPYFTSTNEMSPKPLLPTATNADVVIQPDAEVIVIEEDDDFKVSHRKFRTPGGRIMQNGVGQQQSRGANAQSPVSGPAFWKMEVATPLPSGATGCCSYSCDKEKKSSQRKHLPWNLHESLSQQMHKHLRHSLQSPINDTPKRVPKIYFGTRTHKQIAQITRELGKTAYKDVRMCILASREHTCIDPEVSSMPNKNEECKTKLDNYGCRFQDRVRRVISQRCLQSSGLGTAWDLEDFVSFCKSAKIKACPYFAARQLREAADIVFCPYNYLIDPLIRQSMDINLRDQVLVLDEAHNIEDCARDAASVSVTQQQLLDSERDISQLVQDGVKPTEHMALKNVVSGFNELVERYQQSLGSGDYDQAAKVWTGVDMVAQLDHLGIGPNKFDQLKKCLASVTAVEDTEKGRKDGGTESLHASTKRVLEGLFLVLDFIYRDDLKYMHDYRIAMVRTMSYQQRKGADGQWLSSRKRKGRYETTWTYTLHFWCLNPAVAFSDIGVATRCIVVSSGTLSPMTSFQSELGVPFNIQLEAGHVVGKSQVWVGAIARGPNGQQLLGNYHTSEQLTYQDDVGQLVRDVCATIPHGVLCFFPSYKSLEKICNRWKMTELWSHLAVHKVIMTEPRTGDQLNFDELLRNFYHAISETDEADGGVTGVLLLAVCRGKVSEGIDFTDNNARAVITIGIPYPNIKDTQIQLKKDYNSALAGTRGLLPGGDWYEIQAFRALNQALGRCIRHRNDWGALILVDERFGKNPNKYVKGLSKWVRSKMRFFDAFRSAQMSLAQFTKERLEAASANTSILGSQNLGTISKMDLSASTPNKLTLRTPSPGVATVTSTPLIGVLTPVRPLNDTTNVVLGASPPLPVPIPKTGFTLSSQAGGFLPNHASSQIGQALDTVYPLVSVDKSLMVSILKPVSSLATDVPAKMAAPVLHNRTNHIDNCHLDDQKTEVRSATTLHVESCVTRADSPELFDSEDLSSLPPNTCQVMANIDSVLEEITGEEQGNTQAPPRGAIVKPEGAAVVKMAGAIIKTEGVKQQTISALLSQIVKSKMRNGLTGLDVKEQHRESVGPCHQSIDTSHQSVETSSDMKCGAVQCRKPLFKYVTKSSNSATNSFEVGDVKAQSDDVKHNDAVTHDDTMTHNDAVTHNDTMTHNDAMTADNKTKVRSNTRRASRLNLRRSSVDSVAQHNQSVSEKQIQPLSHHMVTVVKCEPVDGAYVADTSTVSNGTPLKRNVRNKRRRNFGNSCRKKGRGVEFIDEQTEGTTETSGHTVKCRTCDDDLFSATQDGTDIQHVALPSFLSEIATSVPASVKAVVLSHTNRALQNTSILSSKCDGATLNSHWSIKDGCCVQYLCCETCHRCGGQRHLVGAQVVAVTPKVDAVIKIGQVWLIENLVRWL